MKDSGSARACTWICGAIGEGRSGGLQDPPKSWHLQAAEIAVVRAASGPRTQHGLAAFHGTVSFAAHTGRPAIFVEFRHKANRQPCAQKRGAGGATVDGIASDAIARKSQREPNRFRQPACLRSLVDPRAARIRQCEDRIELHEHVAPAGYQAVARLDPEKRHQPDAAVPHEPGRVYSEVLLTLDRKPARAGIRTKEAVVPQTNCSDRPAFWGMAKRRYRRTGSGRVSQWAVI